MKESEILQYIKEKGYGCGKIYYLPRGDWDLDSGEDSSCYRVLISRDWPKSEREPRRWFEAPTLIQLFYEIQREL